MMVDTTVYGYWVPDVGPYCNKCAESQPSLDEDATGHQPLYSTDDTSEEGLNCYGCEEYIFEPSAEYEIKSDIESILLANGPYYDKADKIIQLMHDHGLHPGV